MAVLTLRYGGRKARELAEKWKAPAWLIRGILNDARIAQSRGDMHAQLHSRIRKDFERMQPELEKQIRAMVDKEMEALSEINQI